jgi:DNA-binding MarR family transcriptional regulator
MPRGGASSSRPTVGSSVSSGDRLLSRKILILANLLRRAAAARYRRLLRLAGVEWGLIAHLGQSKPQTLNQIAAGMGLEKAQLSRTVSTLVRRGLVSKKINPHNNREVLISLTREGRRQSGIIHRAGEAANDRLLADFSTKDLSAFVEQIEQLTKRARALLQSEQATASRSANFR